MTPASIDAPEGIVVAVRPGHATVRVESLACRRCAAGRGCGAGILVDRGRRLVEVSVPAHVSLRVGEHVGLSLEPARLLHAAWLAYGVPLIALLMAALVAGLVLPGVASDGLAVGLAGAALVSGGWWARRRLRRAGCMSRFVPSLRERDRRRSPLGPAAGRG